MNRQHCVILFVALWLLAACAAEDKQAIQVEAVWGRPSPQAAANGAFYMSITNNGSRADALRGVRAPRCGAVELHESIVDDADVMRMRPVADGRIPLAAGETVTLRPGGLHVMCVDLATPLSVGEQVPLTLLFADAGVVEVTAEIREGEP